MMGKRSSRADARCSDFLDQGCWIFSNDMPLVAGSLEDWQRHPSLSAPPLFRDSAHHETKEPR
jgi:hypothetical protein